MDPRQINDRCPYDNPGLISIWQRGRRDGESCIYSPPLKHRTRGALEAYIHGYKLGLRTAP